MNNRLLNPATLAAAVKAARAAGKIMRANWHKPKQVNSAEAHDIKLELDVRCQKLIAQILFTAFPQVSLLGEEGCSGDADAGYRWVVDPIDGTVNYFFGIPHACVSIALQSKSRGGDKWQEKLRPPFTETCHPSRLHITIIGVIYDPFTDELWTAVRGGKTRLNGRVRARQPAGQNQRGGHRHGFFQEPGKSDEKPATFGAAFAPGEKNPHPGFRRARTGLCRLWPARPLCGTHHQPVGHRRGRVDG